MKTKSLEKVQYICEDRHSGFKIDDLYVYLNETENRKFCFDFDLTSTDRDKVIIKSKIANLNKLYNSIYLTDNAIADVVIIGAGVAGLTCANQLLSDKNYKSILIIDDKIGGSIALTKSFGIGMLPNFTIDTKMFLKSVENVLTCYNVFLLKKRVNSIKGCVGNYVLECDGHKIQTPKIVLANGCMCDLYRELANNERVFDVIQLRHHRNYLDLLEGKNIGLIFKKKITSELDLLDSSVTFEISNITLKDIDFANDKVCIKIKDIYVDYLVFDSSVFETNKIDGEDNVPREFICGDRNGQIGVLNAINSGISVGKIVASAG